jgi:hypothetical protein
MTTQKVLIVGEEYAWIIQDKIDNILNEGYHIVSVTAQHVSTGSSQGYAGGYLIVFEKSEFVAPNKP